MSSRKPVAWILIHSKVIARIEAFEAGFRSLGFEVSRRTPFAIGPSDVLVIWNRFGAGAKAADRFDAIGRPVLVIENGYVPHPSGLDTLAAAWSRHLGAGSWWIGGPERWDHWGVAIAPWQERAPDAPVLLAPQRGIGPADTAPAADWAVRMEEYLKARTRRPIRIRRHPGTGTPDRPLSDDLGEAAAVAVHASRVGIEALIAGIPVLTSFPRWIGAQAAATGWTDPLHRGDRLAMLRRLAWAQWTIEEIANGTALPRLLRLAPEGFREKGL